VWRDDEKNHSPMDVDPVADARSWAVVCGLVLVAVFILWPTMKN
jgi:hypothetical protein